MCMGDSKNIPPGKIEFCFTNSDLSTDI